MGPQRVSEAVPINFQHEGVDGVEERCGFAVEEARGEEQRDALVAAGRERVEILLFAPRPVAVAAVRFEAQAKGLREDEGVDLEPDFGGEGEEGGELGLGGGHGFEVGCLVGLVWFGRWIVKGAEQCGCAALRYVALYCGGDFCVR